MLNTCYGQEDLTPLTSTHPISLDGWRLSPKVSLSRALSEPANLERCKCVIVKPTTVDLSSDSDSQSVDSMWVNGVLYKLTGADKTSVVNPNGWLNDSVISAAQMLMLQYFPNMRGLQPPTLAKTHSFDTHQTESFVQIIHVRRNHWCVVSNVGCDQGVVNVYDSLYEHVPKNAVRVLASLVLCSEPVLTIRMMNVAMQTNNADCGVLAIAYAHEICSGRDPCSVRFDHQQIRQHLVTCLEKCELTRFPVVSERKCVTRVKKTQNVELFCVCRLPEDKTVLWAGCTSCGQWFHRHCLDIPYDACTDESVEWYCPDCEKSASSLRGENVGHSEC